MSLTRFRVGQLRKANCKRLGFGGGTSTSTSSSDPWSGQQPYLTGLFSDAQNQYSNYTPQYYGYTGTAGGTPTQTGASTVSPMNSQETTAISNIGNLGSNGTQTLTDAGTSVDNILNSNPANNPYFASMNNQISSTVLPGLESQFTQGNSVNNPAMAYAASNGLGTALGNEMYGNYNTGVTNQLNAASGAQNLYNTGLSGNEAALTAGQASQTQAQNELTNNVNAYNYYQTLPYDQINQLANLINGQYGMTTSTSTPNQSLLGSLFSDRRLKEEIRRVGTADNGLPIYAFRYKGDKSGKTHLGFMADEVEQVHPDAVFTLSSGHKVVRYDLAVLAQKKVA